MVPCMPSSMGNALSSQLVLWDFSGLFVERLGASIYYNSVCDIAIYGVGDFKLIHYLMIKNSHQFQKNAPNAC